MANDKILSTLSLAQKAGQIASGEFAVEKSVKDGSACLVIVADDASYNTKKRMNDMTSFYEVPCYQYSTKENLGHCIGKEYRSMIAVKHLGFAESLMKHFSHQSISQ